MSFRALITIKPKQTLADTGESRGLRFGRSDGKAYLVYGKGPGGSWSDMDLANVSLTEGFEIAGAAGDGSFASVGSAGDLDGYDNVMIGAAGSETVYILHGRSGSLQTGTAGTDSLLGTDIVDRLIGKGDDDGADVLLAYGGGDELVVPDGNFLELDGGTGFDRLILDGAGATLDFTQLNPDRVRGIEAVDLTGTGANSVTLTLQDVLDISAETDDLHIDGDADDTVDLARFASGTHSGAWSHSGTATVDGSDYNVYVNADAASARGIY